MESVEWIFADYKAHRSMLQFLREELNQAIDQDEAVTDEDISSMVLASPVIDGMPHVHSNGSSTEWAVIRMSGADRSREALINEIQRYQRLLRLHEAVLRILTNNERWFVENHYYEERPLALLPQIPDSPYAGMSRSTMSNIKKRLLDKVDKFLKQTAMGNVVMSDTL